MSFIEIAGISGGEEYYRASAATACALVQGRGGRKSGGEPPHSKLDDHRFLVFAEDAAAGVGDFADGGVGFDGGEDGGEESFGGGGAALEFDEGGFGAGGMAPGSGGAQAGRFGSL